MRKALVLLLILFPWTVTSATRVRELGLADMTSRAGKVFYGECVDRAVNEDAGRRPTTTYVFRVLRSLKGDEQDVVTFTVAGAPDGRGYVGMPVYEVGDRRLLLLYPPGARGLTSPMGLDQGSFRVVRDAAGNVFAVNGRHNRGLFRDVAPAVLETRGHRRADESIPFDVLENLIRDLVRRTR